MHRSVRTLLVLVGLVAVATSGCAAKKSTSAIEVFASGREPREIYAHGEKMLRQGLYDKAIQDFQELRNFHRDDPLSVRAQLALAEIRFRKNEYEESRYAFEEFATYHPRHEAMDYVTYMIGLATWKQAPKLAGRDQSTTRAAVNQWTGFASRFPDSEYVDEVEKLLQRGIDRLAAKDLWVARFYAKRDAWAAVEGRAASILQRFPTSRHAEESLALLARAYHAVGRPAEAQDARTRLAEVHPDSRFLGVVDRELRRPPGTPPEEEIFVRPYRVPRFNPGAPAGR
jgi:outer membrane protein assembly factor BamD